MDPVLGSVRLARELPARGPREYTLHVRAANPPPAARSSTLPLHVQVVEPDHDPPRYAICSNFTYVLHPFHLKFLFY